MDEVLNIRAIQHFMYCPRRFGLLENDCDWAENASVIRANIMHEHVHDGSHSYTSKNKIVRSSVPVFCDAPEYNLYGITDCIEFVKDAKGAYIEQLDGYYVVKIIEYKPKKPKVELFHETDAIQVFAQKICVDYIWKCNSEAYIYYADVKRRIALPFDTEYERYDQMLKKMLMEMRKILREGVIPEKIKGQKCSACSLEECCFPINKKYCIKEEILQIVKSME